MNIDKEFMDEYVEDEFICSSCKCFGCLHNPNVIFGEGIWQCDQCNKCNKKENKEKCDKYECGFII